MTLDELLANHERVMEDAQWEAVRVAASFNLAVPLEIAPRAWREACKAEEQKRGVKLWKFFSKGEAA